MFERGKKRGEEGGEMNCKGIQLFIKNLWAHRRQVLITKVNKEAPSGPTSLTGIIKSLEISTPVFFRSTIKYDEADAIQLLCPVAHETLITDFVIMASTNNLEHLFIILGGFPALTEHLN